MKVAIRRIGNSLGVIVPKTVLEAWGSSEGDQLEVTARGIRPAARPGLSHQALDELKRSIALAVVRQFTPSQYTRRISGQPSSLASAGRVGPAYEEWQAIAKRGEDGELFAAMLGRDDDATRLRQSMPFVGLLSQEEVRELHEEAAG